MTEYEYLMEKRAFLRGALMSARPLLRKIPYSTRLGLSKGRHAAKKALDVLSNKWSRRAMEAAALEEATRAATSVDMEPDAYKAVGATLRNLGTGTGKALWEGGKAAWTAAKDADIREAARRLYEGGRVLTEKSKPAVRWAKQHSPSWGDAAEAAGRYGLRRVSTPVRAVKNIGGAAVTSYDTVRASGGRNIENAMDVWRGLQGAVPSVGKVTSPAGRKAVSAYKTTEGVKDAYDTIRQIGVAKEDARNALSSAGKEAFPYAKSR